MENMVWLWLIPVILLPVFFAMGWFAARVDMRTVLKHAKAVPTGFYRSLDALVERKTNLAADALNEVIEQQSTGNKAIETLELAMTLGKLYRHRGENDKAIALHQKLLTSPDLIGNRRHQVQFELGQDFQSAGLVDRAEQQFEDLLSTHMGKQAQEVLLNIYQQDRDWQKAIAAAQRLSHDEQTYRFEIAQFYCELAQSALFHSQCGTARQHIASALEINKKCTRANMILGDVESKEGHFQAAIDAYSAIEQQNYAYLSMVGEHLYDAYEAIDKAEEGFNVLIGYLKTFPQLDLINIIYEKALQLQGENKAAELCADLVRDNPSLNGVYRLLGLQIRNLPSAWRSDADMMRAVVGRYARKANMYRCHHCHFKSQVFFWHCPACNKWETFTPNRIEV